MNLNILIINPNLHNYIGQNIGLSYIISSIEKKGHNVKLIDLTFTNSNYKNYILKNIKNYQPDVIGFSTPTFYFADSLKIAKFLRNIYPDSNIPFLWGGVHPTILPDETIFHPLVDAICIGEGEITIREYLDKIQAGKEPHNVAGIWYKDKKGDIIKNKLRPFVENLDSLPFPNWDHWDMEKYINENQGLPGGLYQLLSRGCPYNCSFCTAPVIKKKIPGKFLRYRSIENFIKEVKQNKKKYSKSGLKGLYIHDETFGMNKKILNRFCKSYITENLNKTLPFFIQTRADIITNDFAGKIAEAGCRLVYIGVESANDYIRNKIYKKNISKKDILNACKNLKNAGIPYRLGFVFDISRANKNTVKEDMKFIKKTRTILFCYPPFNPTPKTNLTKKMKQKNLLKDKAYKENWNMKFLGLGKIEYKRITRMLFLVKFLKLKLYLKMLFKENLYQIISICINTILSIPKTYFIKYPTKILLKLESEIITKRIFYK